MKEQHDTGDNTCKEQKNTANKKQLQQKHETEYNLRFFFFLPQKRIKISKQIFKAFDCWRNHHATCMIHFTHLSCA